MALAEISGDPADTLIRLEGRVAVVTGAGRGIGRQIAVRLAEAGASVLVTDLRGEAAQESAELLNQERGRASWMAVDVSDGQAVAALADHAVEALGTIDIWVNNAGVYPFGDPLEISDEEWRAVMAVNLDGAFFGAREAARRMVASKRPGVIVNITSCSAFHASAGTNGAHYVASKHGLTGLTKSLAVQLSVHGIRVLAIAPTLTDTPGVQAAEETAMSETNYLHRIPGGRLASADDVACAVVFAVSPMAAFVSGSTISVDGASLAY